MLAKLYRDPAAIDQAKLEAMLENPPSAIYIDAAGTHHPQYAWPTDLLHGEDGRLIGYLMPRIDEHLSLTLDFYYDRHLFSSTHPGAKPALPYSLEIGRNLAGLVGELHRHGHCFIDFKPQNVKVYRDIHTVALLDCDSYRISSRSLAIFPATNFSSEYIAPEALANPLGPPALSEDQDRFALAVILFQLLNNGIHPFQGIQTGALDLPSTDDKVRAGLYACRLKGNPGIRPVATSIHECFDRGTRRLFDRAFAGTGYSQRPTALEWKQHFAALLDRPGLECCRTQPDELAHVRFAGMPCGACHYERVLEEARRKTGVAASAAVPPRSPGTRPAAVPPSLPQPPASRPPVAPPGLLSYPAFRIAAAVVAVLIGGVVSYVRESPAPEQSSAPVQYALVNDVFEKVILRKAPRQARNGICCLGPGAVVRQAGADWNRVAYVTNKNEIIVFVEVEVLVPARMEKGWISQRAIDVMDGVPPRASRPQTCEAPTSPDCRGRRK